MATPELPTNDDGSLRSYDEAEVLAMDIRRRGVRGEGDHVRYKLSPDGSGCTRKFSCAWDERFNAAIHFAGAVTTYIGLGDTKLSRLIPQRDPDFPNWICTNCEIMPWRFTGGIEFREFGSEPNPIFERAELVCTFEMVPFELVPDHETTSELQRYVTAPGNVGADISTEASYIGLPGSITNYATTDGVTAPAGVPIPYPVGFVEPSNKFKVIWRRVADAAWGAGKDLTQRVIGSETARGYLGALNLTTFLYYPPLSLQLVGVEQRRLPDATGLGYSWDIGYIFTNKPVPYGHLGFYFHDTKTAGAVSGYYQVLRPAAGQTTKAVADLGDNDRLFHLREFSNLFVVGEEL